MRRYIVLLLVVFIYIMAFILQQNIFAEAISNSSYFLIEMAQVMPVILALTVAIEVWIPREMIANNLGTSSKLKGTILSFAMGSISAGPIYAAFPIAASLFKKGASIKNVTIIISSWAVIKIPMLANEAKFLGTQFMAVRWVLTVIAILSMSYITSYLLRRSDIIQSKDDVSEVYVDKGKCIMCRLCIKNFPESFRVESGRVKVLGVTVDAINAINKCPTKAIIRGEKYD